MFTPDEAISFDINSMLQMRKIELDALEDAVARAPRLDGPTRFRNGLLQDGVTR